MSGPTRTWWCSPIWSGSGWRPTSSPASPRGWPAAWLPKSVSTSYRAGGSKGASPMCMLKPNSFATVIIHEPDPQPVVKIPQEALIRTSNQARVIVERPDNRFVPRAVVVAYESQGSAAILSGLEPGEEVVVSGQFMLDSEANLRGELDRIARPDGE